jgi:hypothetical protein
MIEGRSLELAVKRLYRECRSLVAVGDWEAVRQRFASLAASTALYEGENAIEELADEVESLILEPNRRVRRAFPGLGANLAFMCLRRSSKIRRWTLPMRISAALKLLRLRCSRMIYGE